MTDAWVAPDSSPEEPSPAVASPAAGTHAPRAAAPPAAPVPHAVPVPLRPMTIPDLLDGSLRILKLAPGTVLGLAAVVTVPVQVLLGYLSRRSLEEADIGQVFDDAFSGTATSSDVSGGLELGAFALGTVLEGLVLAMVTAGLAVLVAGWYSGQERTLGQVLALAGRRAAPLAAAWVLVHLVEAVFLVGLLVAALVPMTWFAVVSPVVACEHVGPFRALRRSAALTRRRFGAVLGTCLAVVLVDVLLSGALTGGAQFYAGFDLPGAWIVTTAAAAAASLVVTPFVAGVAVLLYLDLRVRSEGLDVELAIPHRFPAPVVA